MDKDNSGNIKDFPKETLQKFDLEVQHPDTFLRYQVDLNPPIFLSSIKAIRERLKNPPRTPEQYLDTLLEHLPQTVSVVTKYKNLI